MENNKIKLRPVVYTNTKFKRGYQNTTQQMFLLKALKVTQDPKKLKELIGVKTVAEVYQTLDKLAMRKEYHQALAKSGITFDFITGGIKKIAETAEKDDTRLKAFQTLLKSVGMDKYDSNSEGNSGTWEEVLLKTIEESKADNLQLEEPMAVYDVVIPKIPESAKRLQDEEAEIASTIYDKK